MLHLKRHRFRVRAVDFVGRKTLAQQQVFNDRSGFLTILVSEQNLHFARLVADRAVIIESVKQKYSGTLDDLNSQPEIRDAYIAA